MEVNRVAAALISFLVLGSAACGSRVQTKRKIEASQGGEASSKGKKRTGYRQWEGSSGQSSEDAASQLGGY